MKLKHTLFLTLLALLFSVNHINAQNQNEMKSFDPAFAHVVYFWLHNPDNASDRQAFEAALTKFLNTSQFAKTKYIGTPPAATRDVVDGSFTYNMVVTFESAEAQAEYQIEQPHLDFIAEASHLWKRVLVYDSMGLGADK
ncbi:Dabb family protein [Robiginitalea sp.]|nr:Dabb family protein [Robiginitalea sp.]